VTRTIRGLTASIDLPGTICEGKDEVSDHDPEDGGEHELKHTYDEQEEFSLDSGIQEEENSSDEEEKALENSQLKEINAELMREVEKLRSQKETLQQQVAVLSEGSAYT
jgi:hypothetical protein